jgi:hypothetical protein
MRDEAVPPPPWTFVSLPEGGVEMKQNVLEI